MLGPDEPRYASIGREMAQSGDWITPRLWGQPWFEKPALSYWMTGAAFRLGLSEDLAPRLPVALLSVAFLIFFQWMVRREFGERAAWTASLILGTSALWLGSSFIGTTDLPMTATFSAAMLLSLEWIEKGERRQLPAAAALLGLAVLAKGLAPLALSLPLLWSGRRRILDWLRPQVVGAILIVALPWYVLCYLRNGAAFLREFFWQQHFARYVSGSLAHGQPFWFYVPVLLAAMLPWTPALTELFRRGLYVDTRRRFLILWAVWVLVFFSFSKNKLPGYVLPMLPPLAVLVGISLAEDRRARWVSPASALCLVVIPAAASVLPQALAAGITRASLPRPHWTWLLPAALAAVIYYLERKGRRAVALGVMALSAAAGVVTLKLIDLPLINATYSARPLWKEIAGRSDQVCIQSMHRSWRYGLNYYSVTPLPDCSQSPRPLEVTQAPGHPPVLRTP